MITIEKAIEVLELNLKEVGKNMPPDVRNALRLSIQAMRRIEYQRGAEDPGASVLLPGETMI